MTDETPRDPLREQCRIAGVHQHLHRFDGPHWLCAALASPTPDEAWPTTDESRVRNQASLDSIASPTPDAAPRLRAETLAVMEGMPPEKVAEWTAETLRQRSPTPDAALGVESARLVMRLLDSWFMEHENLSRWGYSALISQRLADDLAARGQK